MLDSSTQSVIQTAVTAGLPTLSVLVGILINNSRQNDLRADMRETRKDLKSRIDDVQSHMRDLRQDLIRHFDASLQRVEEVMDTRLKHLEERH